MSQYTRNSQTRRTSSRSASARTTDRDGYHTYIQGNTVKRLNTAPKYVQERTPREEHELREKQRAARRNQQHALAMNRGYVIFLTAATMICAVVCGMYIHMQASVTMNMKSLSVLDAQVSELRTDNNAAEKRIGTTMSLEEVKEKAQQELGMSYPSSDQIVHYSVDYSDYMNQYTSIPD